MYAVVKTGGKQYRVSKNDIIAIEKINSVAGEDVELDQVLALDTGKGLTVGTPLVDGARVSATVLEQKKTKKIIVFKKKRRKNYRRTKGHRQQLTVIKIDEILAKGQKATESKTSANTSSTDAKTSKKATVVSKAKKSSVTAKVKAKKSSSKAKKTPAKAKKSSAKAKAKTVTNKSE